MSTENAGGTQSDQPRQRRILVEDILDGLIARTNNALQADAGGSHTPELTAQAEQVVQLAQQLKDAVAQLRQLDATFLTENREAAAPPA